MTATLHRFAALWVGRTHWFLSGVSPDPTEQFPFTASDRWRKEPTADAKIERLLDWAVQLATGVETASYDQLGTSVSVRSPRDEDGCLRFAVIISPEFGHILGADQPGPGQPHPWRGRLEEAGWSVRTRDPKPDRQAGVWLTVERPARKPTVEIGILMAGWCDPHNLDDLATHGLVRGDNGRIDPWETVYLHGEFRRLTRWPLSAGAGMAAVKGLKRTHRTGSAVYWAPQPDEWLEIPVMRIGRPFARPWHVQWSTPHLPYTAGSIPNREVIMWDANADYLVAWSGARFARGMLRHTGPEPARAPNGRVFTGWYLIGDIRWSRDVQHVVDRLPPVWGSRVPNDDGHVWVTHVIVDLLDSLRFDQNYQPPEYRIFDSYSCADSGQLAKPWGETLKAALLTARQEHAARPDNVTTILERTLKQTYARGYPLLETSGLIRRPDHVDTVVDQRWLSAYRRLWKAAWDLDRYPLSVSADEITYLHKAGDDGGTGPLGPVDPFAYGAYKIKQRGTLADWDAALHDGRKGRWWLPAPAPAPEPATVPAQGPQHASEPDDTETEGPWYSRLFSK